MSIFGSLFGAPLGGPHQKQASVPCQCAECMRQRHIIRVAEERYQTGMGTLLLEQALRRPAKVTPLPLPARVSDATAWRLLFANLAHFQPKAIRS